MTEVLAGTGLDDLSDLGISVPKATGGAASDAARAGHLVIDDAKLNAALEGDWTQVKAFFAGFDDQVDAFVKTPQGPVRGHGARPPGLPDAAGLAHGPALRAQPGQRLVIPQAAPPRADYRESGI